MQTEVVEDNEVIKIQLSNALQEAVHAKQNVAKFLNQCAQLEGELYQAKHAQESEAKLRETEAKQIIRLKEVIAQQNQELISVRSQNAQLRTQIEDKENAVDRITKINLELAQRLRLFNDQIVLYKHLESSLRDQIKEIDNNLKEQIETNKQNMTEAEERVSIMAQENNIFNDIAKSAQEQIDKAKQALEDMKKREYRAKKHHENLSDRQNQLRNFIDEIVRELSMNSKLNPVIDLLKITEYEMNKLEVELKKTPTSHPERNHIERTFEQLTEQKNFLRSISDVSSVIWSTKIERLREFSNDFRMEAVPPLAPVNDSILD